MQQYITACDSENQVLQTKAEPEADYAGSAESVLIRIPDDVVDVLCAEPAIRKYSQEKLSSVLLTICCQNADLYVGHPSVNGIMYDLTDEDQQRFERTIVLNPVQGGADERIGRYAEQLGLEVDQENPRIYLTSLDWIRIERFGLSKMSKPIIAMVLSGDTGRAERFDELALELKKHLNAGVVYLSSKKQTVPQGDKNLTGRLMPREIAAVLSRVDCWVSDCISTAVLSRAVESKGILLSDDPEAVQGQSSEVMALDTCVVKMCQRMIGLCEQE